jgi:hypothetical protein
LTQDSTPARLTRLTVNGWRQFDDVDIDFHNRLTVITGANGAGKTTLLNLIGPHFGWEMPMATTPGANFIGYVTDFWRRLTGQRSAALPTDAIAVIEYDDGQTEVRVPSDTQLRTYNVTYSSPRTLPGLYIPSHRPVYVPSDIVTPKPPASLRAAFDRYSERVRSQWFPQTSAQSALASLKESLVGFATSPDTTKHAVLTGFQDVLSKVMPPSLGLRALAAQNNEVLLQTDTGAFLIDAVSGGIAALIDMTWQIYSYAPEDGSSFVVLIDEPENHLHPEMQRFILPRLVQAFEQVQFVVASHAPLIVTSVRDANVYALVYQPQPESPDTVLRRVRAEKLDRFDRAGTANDVLRDVLGLNSAMPVWASEELSAIIARHDVGDASPTAVRELMTDLRAQGLDRYLGNATTMALFAERRNAERMAEGGATT